MKHFDPSAARLHMRIGKYSIERVDRATRHARRFHRGAPFVGRTTHRHTVNQSDKFAPMLHALRVRDEAFVAGPFWFA